MNKILGSILILFLVSCEGREEVEKTVHTNLLQRSSWDLACPQDKLIIVSIDSTNLGVRGCRRKATYCCAEYNNGYTWMLQGTIQPDLAEDQ